jgi:uncharacterized protein YuzE
MVDTTYDPEADAAYIRLADDKVAGTEEAGPVLYDIDADGRVLGIEILACNSVLAPGDWSKARHPEEHDQLYLEALEVERAEALSATWRLGTGRSATALSPTPHRANARSVWRRAENAFVTAKRLGPTRSVL